MTHILLDAALSASPVAMETLEMGALEYRLPDPDRARSITPLISRMAPRVNKAV